MSGAAELLQGAPAWVVLDLELVKRFAAVRGGARRVLHAEARLHEEDGSQRHGLAVYSWSQASAIDADIVELFATLPAATRLRWETNAPPLLVHDSRAVPTARTLIAQLSAIEVALTGRDPARCASGVVRHRWNRVWRAAAPAMATLGWNMLTCQIACMLPGEGTSVYVWIDLEQRGDEAPHFEAIVVVDHADARAQRKRRTRALWGKLRARGYSRDQAREKKNRNLLDASRRLLLRDARDVLAEALFLQRCMGPMLR